MTKKIVYTLVSIFCSSLYPAYITYELSGGRFGDNLLSYFHAQWLSWVYDIPLLHRPFRYSEYLALKGECYTPAAKKWSRKKIISSLAEIDRSQNIVYSVPYFSEDLTEFPAHPDWIYFSVDWNNKAFKKILHDTIQLRDKSVVKKITVPHNKISVAVHIRRGGGVDFPLFDEHKGRRTKNKNCHYADIMYPLKFPPLSFYAEQIKHLSLLVDHAPLFVYIFTDDKKPAALIKKLKKMLIRRKNITFSYRKKHTGHHDYVLEDFFNLTQFNCLIRPQSNFSLCASALTSYQIEIFPLGYSLRNEQPVIDNVKIIRTKKL